MQHKYINSVYQDFQESSRVTQTTSLLRLGVAHGSYIGRIQKRFWISTLDFM